MKETFDLCNLDWKLSGWTPEYWRMHQTMEIGETPYAEIPTMNCNVPCSVQKILRDNGRIKDWNIGTNYRDIEWVEHRHWLFDVSIPNEVFQDKSKKYFLNCEGLDFAGEIIFNGVKIYDFANSYLPVSVELKKPRETDNWLRIAFLNAPVWQGQFGYTSKITTPKVRFYYGWDWTCRFVQVGIWDNVYITSNDKLEFDYVDIDADAENKKGILNVTCHFKDTIDCKAKLLLKKNEEIIRTEEISFYDDFVSFNWKDLDVKLWYPNLSGNQELYSVEANLYSKDNKPIDSIEKIVGFRNIYWEKCEGANERHDNWICVVNGEPTFLQGFNWIPPLHNFADCKKEDYQKLIDVYKDLGVNVFRMNGVAILGTEDFYNLCDEAGILIWQEFPLSSSAMDNTPPYDEKFIEIMGEVAKSYIKRRKHHASLLMWSGGNELFNDSHLSGQMKPCTTDHPMLKNFKNIIEKYDFKRRYIPTSPTGSTAFTTKDNIGKNINENVHGPWKAGSIEEWNASFEEDDAMFRAETGAPSCSPKDILDAYAGDDLPFPIKIDSSYWARPFHWWLEFDAFQIEMGRLPETVEEYITWSQERQTTLLLKAAGNTKKRFPTAGGFIMWMGHDLYPCPANTSLIDYYRRPKPAAIALKEKVFTKKPKEIDV